MEKVPGTIHKQYNQALNVYHLMVREGKKPSEIKTRIGENMYNKITMNKQNVRQKAATGGIERFGMAINLTDPDRQATNLFETVIDIAKKDPANAATNLATMRNIVGDKAYYEGLGIYLNKVFNNSFIYTL